MNKSILFLSLILMPIVSFAAQETKEDVAKKVLNSDGFMCPEGLAPDEKGWWWGCVEPEKKKEQKEQKSQPTPSPKKSAGPTKEQKEELCKTPETWDADKCGFVNPNTIKDYKKAFDFQKKQQEELSKNMVMNSTNEKAVLEYQKYQKWMLKQAAMVGRTWKFNMAQNPDFDYNSKFPVSTYGLALSQDIEKLDEKRTFEIIKNEGGIFIWFTRSDCLYCHKQLKSFKRIKKRTGGLPVFNVSLDDKCIDGFEGEFCKTYDDSIKRVLGGLQIKIVPTLFLYIPNDKEANNLGGTWIRLTNGLVSDSQIISRAYSFFKAHASAIAKGMSSAIKGQPAVDFGYEKPTGSVVIKKGNKNEKK